jgi:NADH-quinone oxidoreductase subunit L
MEGPTPISALIHAATMVTAGIFMVARMSPLFELSDTALSVVLVIGAITALFMGFLGVVQNDIKRVVAYSTLSQLGYMTVALGASAYSVAIFHLMTHAFFKALLFLAAGSVIIALHHDQDIRNMGGLRRYMPITWITSLVGSLALIGTPFFSGFYSKESILIAAHAAYQAGQPGAAFAYFAVTAGVFVTAFYSFRMYFLVFHGKPRFETAGHDAHGQAAADEHGHGKGAVHGHDEHGEHQAGPPRESPAVVTIPLILLAIPSAVIGFVAIDKMLFSDFLRKAIAVNEAAHPAMKELAEEFHGPVAMGLHGFTSAPFFLALAGVVLAGVFYLVRPEIPAWIQARFGALYRLLANKYYLDDLNEFLFAGGARRIGLGLWKGGDIGVIDGVAVNGSARLVGWVASVIRFLQSGYIYHYAFAMLVGIALVLFLFLTMPYVWPALVAGTR